MNELTSLCCVEVGILFLQISVARHYILVLIPFGIQGYILMVIQDYIYMVFMDFFLFIMLDVFRMIFLMCYYVFIYVLHMLRDLATMLLCASEQLN